MFASVAILRRLPKGLDRLDYRLPADFVVKPGQMVTVPFRNTPLPALVLDISSTTSLKEDRVKNIENIINPESFLSAAQINFLTELSAMYQTPLGFLVKSNLPPWKKRKITNLKLEKISDKKEKATKPTLIITAGNDDKKEQVLKNIDHKKNNLIIVPTLEQVLEWHNFLTTKDVAATAVTSENTEKEMFSLWEKIRNQKSGVVVGTRRAFFLPWFNLKKIFLTDDSDENHKSWDMAPRFHNRDACLILSSCHNAELFIVSSTPSPDTYYFATHKIFNQQGKLATLPLPEIVNLKDERRKGNYTVWSDELKNTLSEAKGNVFLFLNRRGSAHYVGCRDCGYTAKCPTCDRTLVYHVATNNLVCHFCHQQQPLPVHCPSCHGVSMVMYGAGTELVENEASKNWGNKHQIERIDSDTNHFSHENNDKPKIIVGTQMAWQKIDWVKITTVAFLDIDTELFQSDYRTAENVWHDLRSITEKVNPGTKLIVQTSHPEHRIFSFLNRPEEFYHTELEERKTFKYPPFNYLVRLWRGFPNQALAMSESEKLVKKLEILTKNVSGVIISGSLEMTPFFYQQQYWQAILIRLPYEFYKKYTKIIAEATPAEWKFDPNPSRILSLN